MVRTLEKKDLEFWETSLLMSYNRYNGTCYWSVSFRLTRCRMPLRCRCINSGTKLYVQALWFQPYSLVVQHLKNHFQAAIPSKKPYVRLFFNQLCWIKLVCQVLTYHIPTIYTHKKLGICSAYTPKIFLIMLSTASMWCGVNY